MEYTRRRSLSVLLCLVMVLTLLPAGLIRSASATAADDLEPSLLGSLSIKYESQGNPESVGRVAGDPGGASYGLYMFSSVSGVPQAFFKWLQASDNAVYQSFGDTLDLAYNTGTPGCGPLFDNAWKQCAAENREAFTQAQHDYARERFYLPLINKLHEKLPAFDVNNYSIALRSVLMSRAIQHGASDGAGLVADAFKNLPGGFANQPESELIRAIYTYNARLDSSGKYPLMSGATAEKYGVSGKTLYCFRGCSGDVQLGVYMRLMLNEPADAQTMLVQYGYGDAPLGEGLYSIAAPANENLRIDSDLKLSDTRHQFRLTYFASGYYTLDSEDGKTRLSGKSDGSVAMTAPSADNSQLWQFCRYNSGFALKNRATGRYLTASSLSAGGKLTTGETMVQWQFAPGNAGWTLIGAVYPTAANGLVEGSSSFPFKGTLRSTNAISAVRAAILNASGTTLYEATATPNTTSYNLAKMDSQMAFSKLKPGSYTLLITADDTSGDHYEQRSEFRVASKVATVTYTFDPNGGSCSPTSLNAVPGVGLAGLPTPTRSGYAFAGWFDENGVQVSNGSAAYARNTKLTAHWEQQYTYTFYDYDGKTVLASGTLVKGQTIPAPNTPGRAASSTTYYTFRGWSGYTSGMTMGTANLTFTAQYDEHAVISTEISVSGGYKLSGGYLRSIPAGTSAQTLLSALSPASYVTLRDKNGNAVSGKVGTGMTAVLSAGGATVQTVTIVLTGDTNGDGATDVTDMMQINAHLLGRTVLSGAAAQAADINGDGVIDVTDFAQSLAVTLKRRTIQPN
ncbi:MAG: InlB B-repeat-containing protein [Oscillospiraceae bacterium]|nr:InlB B-repeat-containing protein [Oscillospiraceae bacterium]